MAATFRTGDLPGRVNMADFTTATVSCHDCDARIAVTVPRRLPKGSYIVARHLGIARHAPELWQGQRRIA